MSAARNDWAASQGGNGALDWKGLVLVHRHFGYCKVIDQAATRVTVHFIGANRDVEYSVRSIERDFAWRPLPVGMKCKTVDGRECTITEAPFGPAETHGAHEYVVTFEGEGAETARLNERELWPIPDSVSETPLGKLASLQVDTLTTFRAREGFLRALLQIDHESAGIRALATGRLELLPHQAFVIGTVIDDPVWRYILADEVGLGKTIEAGAIAHQLLNAKPEARILVLCPGPLSRQWLCEMHQSFGGRDFRLLDLYGPGTASIETWPLVISSLKLAERHYASRLLASQWDLAIVDEAHRLLWNSTHYEFVRRLAVQVPRLLLLSAVPARERDSELLKLLQLIDPEQYASGGLAATHFSELYGAQSLIGRRVRIISRQLEAAQDLDRQQLSADVDRLCSIPLLRRDSDLLQIARSAMEAVDLEDVVVKHRRLIDEVVSRYRISRRILKNRRARLIDSALLGGVERSVVMLSYQPPPLEIQVGDVALDLLRGLSTDSNSDALDVLFRKTAQALCDPVALFEIASELAAGDASAQPDARLFEASAILDYDEHDALLQACGAVFGNEVDEQGLKRLIALLRAAMEVEESQRIVTLKAHLLHSLEGGGSKFLVFAGTYGTAAAVADSLSTYFGAATVAAFRHDLSDDTKEEEVARFRRRSECRILVCDESGGEGRNFQFVDELIHFDLPWSVASVEQRVGRLDRIGRQQPVRSVVICPSGGIEEAWCRCLRDGFAVFSRSISGLEFMLHATERRVVGAALQGGPEGLAEIIPDIREASDHERATDDAEAVTDVASFRNTSPYLKAAGSGGDAVLEKALPAYLQSVGGSRAAKQLADRKDTGLTIWRLSPDAVADYELTGMQRQGDTPLSERYGTFIRTVARERRDLEFFTVGHPVVDALALAMLRHVRGRAFVVRLRSASAKPDAIMLSAWRVHGLRLDGTGSVPELALRRLGRRVVWVGIDLATGEEVASTTASRLLAALVAGEGAEDISRERAPEVFDLEYERWAGHVNALAADSANLAAAAYKTRFGEKDLAFCKHLLRAAQEVKRKRPDENASYSRERELTVRAIEAATLSLDVVGLLKVDSA